MEMKTRLSTLWLFATLNYIYCDVIGLMNPPMLRGFLAGHVAGIGIDITQGFLLGAGVLVEIPMAMVLLSRVLGYRANRVANILAGVTMTAVQLASNAFGSTPYYIFFSVIEIAATSVIVWYALRWRREVSEPSGQTESLRRMPTAR